MNQSTENTYPGSEECFRCYFEEAGIGMALLGLDGRWLRANRTLCQILGYSEAELLATTFEQISHPADLPSYRDHLRNFLAEGGRGPQVEKRYLHRDGHVVWVRITLSLIWNADGNPRLLFSQIEDVTGRRQMELTLRESEERFRMLAVSAPWGVFWADQEGKVVEINLKYGEITGLTLEDSLDEKWQRSLYPGDREEVLAAWNIAIYSGSEFDREFRFLKPGGGIFWVRAKMVPIRDFAGEITGFVGSCIDIDQIKILEQRLTKQKSILEKETQRIQEAGELKSKFLTHMSHELRTPLNGIIGFSELLYDQKPGRLNLRQREFIGDVLQNSRHLLRLVNDLLDLSKIEAGRLWLNPETFSLREAIAAVAVVLQAPIQSKSLSYSVEMLVETDDVFLDRQKISQILYNLLSNAIKFTPDSGSILLRVTERDGQIELAVHDTGIGIKPVDLERIFVGSEQGETDPQQRHLGAGLGLMLTKKLASLHGGTIRVESVPGHSTTFIVSLPHFRSTRS